MHHHDDDDDGGDDDEEVKLQVWEVWVEKIALHRGIIIVIAWSLSRGGEEVKWPTSALPSVYTYIHTYVCAFYERVWKNPCLYLCEAAAQ